jgi:hypothetical protein
MDLLLLQLFITISLWIIIGLLVDYLPVLGRQQFSQLSTKFVQDISM